MPRGYIPTVDERIAMLHAFAARADIKPKISDLGQGKPHENQALYRWCREVTDPTEWNALEQRQRDALTDIRIFKDWSVTLLEKRDKKRSFKENIEVAKQVIAANNGNVAAIRSHTVMTGDLGSVRAAFALHYKKKLVYEENVRPRDRFTKEQKEALYGVPGYKDYIDKAIRDKRTTNL